MEVAAIRECFAKGWYKDTDLSNAAGDMMTRARDKINKLKQKYFFTEQI